MLLTLFVVAIALIAVTAVYCILIVHNMIRILLAMELLIKAVTLLIAVAGAYSNQMALAQSFIIALIIIEVVVTATGAGIVIAVHEKNGSLDLRKLTNIKG